MKPSSSARRKQRARPADGPPPVVGFVALGCPKNLVDSEVMLARIAESGAIISADEHLADTIVVNTCGFLEAARAEVLAVLRELAERKRCGSLRRIVVVGCLVQRDGAKLFEAVPEIDALVGVHNRDDVVRAVIGGQRTTVTAPGASVPGAARRAADFSPRGAARGGTDPALRERTRRAADFSPRGAAPAQVPTRRVDVYLSDYHWQPWSDAGRLRLTPAHYAYVRISEGCDQKCTFCTIPSIRGPLRSKSPEQILAECRELTASGARELILIGQDTTSYGRDCGYEPGLAGLLRKLSAECAEARWLRLMYTYPRHFSDELIDALAECARVVKYVDLPLQHINDGILRAMSRRVTRRQTERLLGRIRRRIPGVVIRTTLLVGFPGESEAAFAELLGFVRDFGFDALGAFEFSAEPGTPAARMRDQVPANVRRRRYERLMELQQELAFAAARRRIGERFEVVVDGPDGSGRAVARHAGQAPEVDAVCLLEPERSVRRFGPGRFLTVRCVGSAGYDLLVRPVER